MVRVIFSPTFFEERDQYVELSHVIDFVILLDINIKWKSKVILKYNFQFPFVIFNSHY